MTGNLFLTGPRQIGKSTALQRFLADYPGAIRGFLTRWNPEGQTLHMLDASAPEGFTAANIVARRIAGRAEPDPAAFDRIGTRLLAESAPLYVMDELGFLERDAHAFRARILALLQGATPVVGVVRQTGSIFLDRLQTLENTAIWLVASGNRDEIPARLARHFR